ncbi:hypothetical protein HPP92_007697 [Vanilla planifolia]|uniref:Uncharacterized protein n=1 Tax=Vanilla planifolia TaxID=51239 RepID=A0A835RAP4_VANPL|nr:hypothetical protein HPP92_007697 [Vanilla planifolia]
MKNASHERHHGKSQPQENDFIYHDRVGSVERAVTRDSVIGDALKAKSSKQSSRQICSESDLFLSETTDLDNLGKKLKDHRDQPSVQRLKKGDVMYEQSKHTNSSGDGNCDGDNLVTKDEGTQQMIHHSSTSDAPCSNLFTISPSDGMTTIAAPSDSAEDTPYQLRRYKVVRKLLNRRSEKVMNSNFEKSLAVPSGRTFDDVSGTRLESENSDMNPEEMMTKTTALKSRMETNSSASDADSDEQDETNEKADGNLSELSRRKLPLSVILKSSSMYKKAKLGVLQSELEAETGSQPVDVVLETQPEPSSS